MSGGNVGRAETSGNNIKQMAQTLLFLEEHNLRDYDELAAKAKDVSAIFGEISERQKVLEARLTEITESKNTSLIIPRRKRFMFSIVKADIAKSSLKSTVKKSHFTKLPRKLFRKFMGSYQLSGN